MQIQVPFGIFCMAVCILTIPNPEDLDDKPSVNIWGKLKEFDVAGSFYLVKETARSEY